MNNLYEKKTYQSMRKSSYDRTGGNNDSVLIPPGQSHTVVLQGKGIIKHIWITFLHDSSSSYHSQQITFQFDGNEPSVDMSVADFFALPTGNVHDVNSLPIQVSKTKNHPRKEIFEKEPFRGSMNCYWPMPFLQEGRITFTNHDEVPVRWYYHIDWEQHEELPEDILYFHAVKNSEMTKIHGEYVGHATTDFEEVHFQDEENYVFCDIQGYEGHYVGLSLMVKADSQCNSSWWEGDEMLVIDGEDWPPRLHGTGLEDYFGLAYGFRVVDCRPQYGVTYVEKEKDDPTQIGGLCCMYRFHLDSPVVFKKSFRGSLEHGHANKTDAFYSSVAYWYGRKL